MKILKTFELYRSTYFRAANSLKSNQPKRQDRLRKYGQEKGLYKNFFIPDYKFDIYVDFVLDNDHVEDEQYEHYPRKVLRDVKIQDYLMRYDGNEMAIELDLDSTGHPNWQLSINVWLGENGGKARITIFDDNNKFANRKSAVQFMKLLHKLYLFQDPNVMRKATTKMSGGETTELTYKDVDDHNLWGFFQEHGYDWNKFKSEININDLWDHYE
tara:strand:+ start:2371 stop:3012 length:642 start_codon:yes stop_codon:yes gene_type:complete